MYDKIQLKGQGILKLSITAIFDQNRIKRKYLDIIANALISYKIMKNGKYKVKIRKTLKLAQIASENTAEGASKCKITNKSDLHVKNICPN